MFRLRNKNKKSQLKVNKVVKALKTQNKDHNIEKVLTKRTDLPTI